MDNAKDLNAQKGVLLIEDFSNKAKDWGWQEDQGWGRKMTNSLNAWRKSKKALTDYVQDLERNNAVLTKEVARIPMLEQNIIHLTKPGA